MLAPAYGRLDGGEKIPAERKPRRAVRLVFFRDLFPALARVARPASDRALSQL